MASLAAPAAARAPSPFPGARPFPLGPAPRWWSCPPRARRCRGLCGPSPAGWAWKIQQPAWRWTVGHTVLHVLAAASPADTPQGSRSLVSVPWGTAVPWVKHWFPPRLRPPRPPATFPAHTGWPSVLGRACSPWSDPTQTGAGAVGSTPLCGMRVGSTQSQTLAHLHTRCWASRARVLLSLSSGRAWTTANMTEHLLMDSRELEPCGFPPRLPGSSLRRPWGREGG